MLMCYELRPCSHTCRTTNALAGTTKELKAVHERMPYSRDPTNNLLQNCQRVNMQKPTRLPAKTQVWQTVCITQAD